VELPGLLGRDLRPVADHLAGVQTPQAFRAVPLLEAHRRAAADGYESTDTAACFERYTDLPVVAVHGGAANLKVTFPEDLAVAERLLQSMSAEIVAGEQSLHVGLSIGIAVYPSDGHDVTTLLSNANAALYRAKTAGRGTIRFFEAHMDEHLRERRALQHELHAAIEQDELTLYYQPQARISGETIGFEALVRWHHPIRGTVSPGMFIPLAEESGLIMQMGEWILREACREAASWPKSLQVAVNLSPVQFRTAICRRWCTRSCSRPGSRRTASSSRSPKAC